MSKGAPLGAIAQLYLDRPKRPVEEGHIIRTTTTGRTYRVVYARRAKRPEGAPERWYLQAVVVASDSVADDDVVHDLAWYRRSRS